LNNHFKHTVIGIDPGKTGAMAVFRGMRLDAVYDTPLMIPKKGAKSQFDLDGMRDFLIHEQEVVKESGADVFVSIEQQHAFPAQGGVGNFTSGSGYYAWLMAFKCLRIPFMAVTAMYWRSLIFVEGESQVLNAEAKSHGEANKMRKAASIIRAQEVPHAKEFVYLKKHDGRAEAILIGLAARRANINQKSSL
jgi:hypothetical protein